MFDQADFSQYELQQYNFLYFHWFKSFLTTMREITWYKGRGRRRLCKLMMKKREKDLKEGREESGVWKLHLKAIREAYK